MYNRQHIKEQEDEQCLISSKALIWILPAKGRNVAEGHYVAESHYVHAAQGRNVAEGHYEAAQTMVAPAAFKCTCGRRKAIRVHPKRRAGFWAKEIILDLTIAICRYSAG